MNQHQVTSAIPSQVSGKKKESDSSKLAKGGVHNSQSPSLDSQPSDSGLKSQSSSNGPQLSPFEAEVIAIFVEMMHTLGLPKSYGEIYGLLYATPEPLGFAEIHDKLTLSKGSVSGGLKVLKEIGAVRLVQGSEDRRERFEPELELRKLVLSYMKERLQPQVNANAARMDRLDELLVNGTLDPISNKILNGRLDKLAKWRKKASGLLPWIARFLG